MLWRGEKMGLLRLLFYSFFFVTFVVDKSVVFCK